MLGHEDFEEIMINLILGNSFALTTPANGTLEINGDFLSGNVEDSLEEYDLYLTDFFTINTYTFGTYKLTINSDLFGKISTTFTL